VTLHLQSVQLSLWDTAGQERFHALGPIYYRDAGNFCSTSESLLLYLISVLIVAPYLADGALLVYDITDEQSFLKVKTWVSARMRDFG
jgi:Ras-related protein Rab-21